jgi:hypothetical protein
MSSPNSSLINFLALCSRTVKISLKHPLHMMLIGGGPPGRLQCGMMQPRGSGRINERQHLCGAWKHSCCNVQSAMRVYLGEQGTNRIKPPSMHAARHARCTACTGGRKWRSGTTLPGCRYHHALIGKYSIPERADEVVYHGQDSMPFGHARWFNWGKDTRDCTLCIIGKRGVRWLHSLGLSAGRHEGIQMQS